MPVLHRYTDGSGYYIRSSVDGQFVTFQVAESAEDLLSELGYIDGDDISWELLEPLWEHGFLYTGESETTTKVGSHIDDRQLTGLDEDQKAKVKEFFDEHYRRSITVPDEIYATLEEWHDGRYSIERARDLFYRANDEERWQESIQEFRQSPLEVTGIESSEGDPAYEVVSRGESIRCVDVRRTQKQVDLIITFRGDSGYSQALFIWKGDLTGWRIYAPSDERGPVIWREALDRMPSIAAVCDAVPSYDADLDGWEFIEASPHPIPNEVADCLQLDWDWVAYSLGRPRASSTRCRGQVKQVTSIRHGILSTDELQKDLVFEMDEGGIQEGDEVTFRIRRAAGRTRATDVRVRDSGDVRADPDESTKYRTRRSQG